MFNLLARLVGGTVQPLIDRLSAAGISLVRRLALFLVAGLCFVVVLIALTVALDLWVAELAGPIAGALTVAAVYLAVGLTAGGIALRGGAKSTSAAGSATADSGNPAKAPEAETKRARRAQIDQFIAPLLDMLQRLGLRREQLAVLAGASIAKQLNPVPLLGLAIIAGFVVGRMWKGWDALFSLDVVTALLSMFGLPHRMDEAEPEDLAA